LVTAAGSLLSLPATRHQLTAVILASSMNECKNIDAFFWATGIGDCRGVAELVRVQQSNA
jgi:hypothetical protein